MTKKNANKRAARERQAQLGGHYLAHYRLVAAGENSADEELVTDNQRDDVLRLAVEAGIPRERFDGWDGARIALFRSLGNTSWVDLGLFAFQITRTRWELFKEKLDDAGLGYETKDPIVEGAWEQRPRSGERHSVVVLKAPAVLEDFKVDVRSTPSDLLPAPEGGTGKGHELAYNFAAEKDPQFSLFNRIPQRWERASALMFDVFVASPPTPNPPLEVVAFMPLELLVTIQGLEELGHAVLLGPGWTTVRHSFDDGKWKPVMDFWLEKTKDVAPASHQLDAVAELLEAKVRLPILPRWKPWGEAMPAFEKQAREFDLSDVEPIMGLTFTLLGLGRKDFGKIFISNITIV